MIYQEIPVDANLMPYFFCYWKFVVPSFEDGRGVLPHYIMPDGSPSLVFFHQIGTGFKGMVLHGPTKYLIKRELPAPSITIGIRLKPGWSTPLFGKTGAELREKTIFPLPAIKGLDLRKTLHLLEEEHTVFDYFNQTFLSYFKHHHSKSGNYIATAAQLILQKRGNLKIAQLVKDIPLSERQLQKCFKRETGLTLKEFAMVMRIRNALIQLQLFKKDFQEVLLDAGYFDQAHFIRDFSKISKIPLADFKAYIQNIHHLNVQYRE